MIGRGDLDAFPVVFDPPNSGGGSTTYYTYNNCGPAWVEGSGSGCSTNDGGTAAEVAVRIQLDWIDSCGDVCDVSVDHDFDIQLIDGGFTVFKDTDGSTERKPESTLYNYDDGDFHLMRFSSFFGTSGGSHATFEYLGNGGICADDGGCVIGGER